MLSNIVWYENGYQEEKVQLLNDWYYYGRLCQIYQFFINFIICYNERVVVFNEQLLLVFIQLLYLGLKYVVYYFMQLCDFVLGGNINWV